jgi:hypothetical protein
MYKLEIKDAEGNLVSLQFSRAIGAINALEAIRYWSEDVAQLTLSTEDGPQTVWTKETR